MKHDFQHASRKIRLYEELGPVITLHLRDASSYERLKENGTVPKDAKYAPRQLQDEFLATLDRKSIKHEVIFKDESILVFAVGRAKNDEACQASRDFFSGARCYLLKESRMIDMGNPLPKPIDAVLKIVSPARRNVSKAVARLNGI